MRSTWMILVLAALAVSSVGCCMSGRCGIGCGSCGGIFGNQACGTCDDSCDSVRVSAMSGMRHGCLHGGMGCRTSTCDGPSGCDEQVGCDDQSCSGCGGRGIFQGGLFSGRRMGCDSCDGAACDGGCGQSCDSQSSNGCDGNCGPTTPGCGCDSAGRGILSRFGDNCGCNDCGATGCADQGCSGCDNCGGGRGGLLGGARGRFGGSGDCCSSCGQSGCNGSCCGMGRGGMFGGGILGGGSGGYGMGNGYCADGCGNCNNGGCGGMIGNGFADGGVALAGGHFGCGRFGCGTNGWLCANCRSRLGAHRNSRLANNHPYGGQIPHTTHFPQDGGMQGAAAPTYAYPYYTTRGPRDFLLNNPPSIGW